MSDTILAGDFTIYYSAENRRKQIIWTGSATGTRTVNELYSALQNHFDELTQMDDGVPMSAQTPTEYTIGIIDAGDKDPWFIDRTTVEHLQKGALTTKSWLRNDTVQGGIDNVGIVRVAYTVGGTDFDATDIGRDIKDATDNDIGTLLDFNTVLSTKVAWIRPDTTAQANSFDGGANILAIQNDTAGQVWQVDEGVAFVDETADANNVTNADWTIFPATESTTDYVAIGYRQKFKKVIFDNANGTAGTVGVVVWEYWNGAWTSLAGVTDGTTGFTAAVADGQTLTFTVPTDWVASSLNGSPNLFYIRARITTVYSVNPVYDQIFIGAYGSVTKTAAVALSGESLWSNIYTLGTLENYTHIYIFQSTGNLVAYKDTTDWWSDKTTGQIVDNVVTDHIDILVNVKEVGTEIDEAWIKVYARQYSKTYSYYSVDLTNGGRNPIPLQTGNDLDNQSGYKKLTLTGSASSFDVGNYIYWTNSGALTWLTTTKRGKITAVSGNDISYYLLSDPITDFLANETVIQEYTGTADGNGTGTVNGSNPVAAGPAALVTPPTFTFGGLSDGGTYDINEDSTLENYSIRIDCNQHTLGNVYEYAKYLTRRGSTADIAEGALVIEGQFYLGTEYRLKYTGSPSGAMTDGNTVSQETSGATGIIVNHNTTDKIFMLRSTRGTFITHATTATLTDTTTTNTVEINSEATAVTPIAAAPFGTFAGGKFFCATGVVLIDYDTTVDANNFQLVDDEGFVRKAPTKATITISNTKQYDKLAVFRLTGSGLEINKAEYNATSQNALVTTAIMSGSITNDSPGRSLGGALRLVDASANIEYRIRFSSWTGTTFTLANLQVVAADAGTDTDTIIEAGAFTSTAVKRGDIVVNVTRGNAVSYVVDRVSNNEITISPAITGQTTGDNIWLNVLPVGTTTTPQDTWYVPFIDLEEDADGSEAVTITHATSDPDIFIRVRARHSSAATGTRIIPFEQDASVVGITPTTVSVVRTPDSIIA